MNDRLHVFLLLLALLDLGFVHATGAVEDLLLLPLWLLAIASPWLRRLQRFRVYRAGWNGGVLIVFALLVQHATTTGLLHMLEDGLVLAVLCQVHLLNNVGDRQRPDLTFFNSFLIAFVTSFFAADLWWSLLFVAHSFVLVPALQVYVLVQRAPDLPPDVVRAALRDSLPRTLVVGVITALVFVFWPRDFERRGWLGDNLQFGQQLQAGMSERIELGRNARMQLSDEVVARLDVLDGTLDDVPMHWRTTAFSEFDGRTWFPQDAASLGSRFGTDTQWQMREDGTWLRPGRSEPRARVAVRLLDRDAETLPCALHATHITPRELGGRVLNPRSYGGFQVVHVGEPPTGALSYEVDIAQPQPPRSMPTTTRLNFLQLPGRLVPALAYDLAAKLRAELPADADELAIAAAMRDWLQQNRRYQLPGESGSANNLGEFLLGTAAGHCEYFATVLALLLRTQDVPCRLVGGYLVHERTADGGSLLARARDAHAWVEVLAGDGSWHTFDATPATDARANGDDQGFWAKTIDELQALWAEVAAFDDDARRRLLESLLTLPVRRPLTTGLFLLVIVLLVRRSRQRRRQRQPAIRRLERALHRAKLELRPGETPRELLLRADAQGLDERVLDAVRDAAREHERQRYGSPPRARELTST